MQLQRLILRQHPYVPWILDLSASRMQERSTTSLALDYLLVRVGRTGFATGKLLILIYDGVDDVRVRNCVLDSDFVEAFMRADPRPLVCPLIWR